MSAKESLMRAPRKVRNTLRMVIGEDVLAAQWATQGVLRDNWGDKLNRWLIEKVSNKKVFHRSEVYSIPGKPVHYVIGSHLATACADPRAVIWGAGFISSTIPIEGRPKSIRAVRGWLSNERLREAGLPAPDVVGDTALLLPRLYEPKRKLDRCGLGVIPHCYEWDEPLYRRSRMWPDTKVINIRGPIESVIEQIVSCDKVMSSSLHGIICADAFGIPAIWLNASNKPLGDGFKFRDYFSSVGRPDVGPIQVEENMSRNFFLDSFYDYDIRIDLDALIKACPF